ncbi:hypothetical protein G9A89_000270 [Geosiphon pyriformis]|nr:hypothetical protein G9A89_000270 [Geosiphon pyriformis]
MGFACGGGLGVYLVTLIGHSKQGPLHAGRLTEFVLKGRIGYHNGRKGYDPYQTKYHTHQSDPYITPQLKRDTMDRTTKPQQRDSKTQYPHSVYPNHPYPQPPPATNPNMILLLRVLIVQQGGYEDPDSSNNKRSLFKIPNLQNTGLVPQSQMTCVTQQVLFRPIPFRDDLGPMATPQGLTR